MLVKRFKGRISMISLSLAMQPRKRRLITLVLKND